MNLFSKFAEGLPLGEFLAKYGTDADRAKWQRAADATRITDAQRQLLGKFTRQTNVLALAGAWCGDCAAQCPIFERFAEAAPVITVRYLDRDEHAVVQHELQINGGDRVPVAVFFSEDGFEVARYGERTLARYRQLVEQLTGESCATGLVKSSDPVQMQVVQDWLDEFERVQWLLRLSPRLRRLHGD
ncbi:MAG TPA: thioredoxin family protein [Gemmataceae bacterium]|nr:thioredoxin family protein [Gemmataceae bacterium]